MTNTCSFKYGKTAETLRPVETAGCFLKSQPRALGSQGWVTIPALGFPDPEEAVLRVGAYEVLVGVLGDPYHVLQHQGEG